MKNWLNFQAMPDKNYKLIIQYDGTGIFGWQRQREQKSIQGEIEIALSRILNRDIKILGSGRTDAGVHAFGQVANFHADTQITPYELKKGVTSLLKPAIVIQDCSIVEDSFHARYSAVSKEYHYVILNREDPCPIGRFYQWHIRQPLDVDAMNLCCEKIVGVFDFKSFENTGSPRNSSVREIFSAGVDPMDKEKLVFKVSASGFLKNMVRILVGTLVLAGLRKISVDDFWEIVAAKDRTRAGNTAPAQGLFLVSVTYS